MATECAFCEASMPWVDAPPWLHKSSVLVRETPDVTTVSTLPTTSSASAAVATSPAITSQPDQHGLPAGTIVLIAIAAGVGLAIIIVLPFIIRRRLRKSLKARDKRWWFWRRSANRSVRKCHELSLGDLERAARASREMPAVDPPPSLPRPWNFADSHSSTGSQTPPTTSRPALLPRLWKKAVDSIRSIFKPEPEPLVPPSPNLPYGFSYAYYQWGRKIREAERKEEEEVQRQRERVEARALAKKNAAEAAAADVRSASADLGLQGRGEASDMVEICLDEQVALDEQERLERQYMEQRENWDAARRSLSPFPKPAPPMSTPPYYPDGSSESANSALDDRLDQEIWRWTAR